MIYSVALFSLALLLAYTQIVLPVREIKRAKERERFDSSYRVFKAITLKKYHPDYKSQSVLEILDDPSLERSFDSLNMARQNETGQEIWWSIKSELEN